MPDPLTARWLSDGTVDLSQVEARISGLDSRFWSYAGGLSDRIAALEATVATRVPDDRDERLRDLAQQWRQTAEMNRKRATVLSRSEDHGRRALGGDLLWQASCFQACAEQLLAALAQVPAGPAVKEEPDELG